MPKKGIVFVTGNKNKVEELRAIVLETLGPDWTVASFSLDLPEPQGTAAEIVTEKCRKGAERVCAESPDTVKAVVVEDTSLCFNAMGGLPGPYIRWFLEKLGPTGLHKMLAGFDDKTAEATCTIAISIDGGKTVAGLFEGVCKGRIVAPRGSNHFGWDPCFEPWEQSPGVSSPETFAEMKPLWKNTISHRRRALDGLRTWILSNLHSFT